ncbi:MAG: precorrin-8X methylmutase [Lachnospiraceae bacterium]|nr:precorrin-8X methylmutase [Lachnospiraceae bacterium]
MKEYEYVLPEQIEARSFEIIKEELIAQNITLRTLASDGDCPIKSEPVIKRVIHTTADFDYADNLVFSENALTEAYKLFTTGCVIVTDTNMALAGINKSALNKLGIEAFCYMADESVIAEAKDRGLTRAAVSMERAAKHNKPVIYAIGNAPTALITIYEAYENYKNANVGTDYHVPGLVIGVPVGFVNVVPAKEMITDSGLPYIVAKGRKGGSNVAAAIVNALMYQLTRR